MSPKDLCTINILNQVISSGVDDLKIEGRSKGADYVYAVTQCYREALQAIEQDSCTPEKIEEWMKRLSTVYNRGFWEGYYLGHKLGEWTTNSGSVATEKKSYIGKGSKYYPNLKVGEFIIEAGEIKIGDTLMIIGPAIGVAKEKIETLTVNDLAGNLAIKGDKITFPYSIKINPLDKLYKIIEKGNV